MADRSLTLPSPTLTSRAGTVTRRGSTPPAPRGEMEPRAQEGRRERNSLTAPEEG